MSKTKGGGALRLLTPAVALEDMVVTLVLLNHLSYLYVVPSLRLTCIFYCEELQRGDVCMNVYLLLHKYMLEVYQ